MVCYHLVPLLVLLSCSATSIVACCTLTISCYIKVIHPLLTLYFVQRPLVVFLPINYYFSIAPFSYKLGLVRTLEDRVYKINNTWLGFVETLRS